MRVRETMQVFRLKAIRLVGRYESTIMAVIRTIALNVGLGALVKFAVAFRAPFLYETWRA